MEINNTIKKSMKATEMWCYRRILRIPWTGKQTNEEVLKKTNDRKKLITKIRTRQCWFIGHVIRRGQPEHLVTTGMWNGKRNRGGSWENILDSLALWFQMDSVTKLLDATRDREKWEGMIAYASRHGTWRSYYRPVLYDGLSPSYHIKCNILLECARRRNKQIKTE